MELTGLAFLTARMQCLLSPLESRTTYSQLSWLEKEMACLKVEQWFGELACA